MCLRDMRAVVIAAKAPLVFAMCLVVAAVLGAGMPFTDAPYWEARAAAGVDLLQQSQTYTVNEPGTAGAEPVSTRFSVRTWGVSAVKTVEDPWYSLEFGYRWAKGAQFRKDGATVLGETSSYGLWALGALTLASSQTAKFQLAAAYRTNFTQLDEYRFKTTDYLVGLRTFAVNAFGGFSRTFVSIGPSRNEITGPAQTESVSGWRVTADSSIEMPVALLGFSGFFVKTDLSSSWLLWAGGGQARIKLENSSYDTGVGLGVRF